LTQAIEQRTAAEAEARLLREAKNKRQREQAVLVLLQREELLRVMFGLPPADRWPH
jgi:hypothetical protein